MNELNIILPKNGQVFIDCPYSGCSQPLVVKYDEIKTNIPGAAYASNLVYCDTCDRDFVVEARTEVVIIDAKTIGPSQPETCQSCIHWEEMKETPFMDAGGKCNYYTNAIHGEGQIHTASNHSCAKWEPR